MKQFHDSFFGQPVESHHIGTDEIAFHDDRYGHGGGREFDVHISRRQRFVARFRKHGHGAVGFDHGVFNFARVEIAVSAQGFEQVVDVHVQFVENFG